jgi:hypothetical protein
VNVGNEVAIEVGEVDGTEVGGFARVVVEVDVCCCGVEIPSEVDKGVDRESEVGEGMLVALVCRAQPEVIQNIIESTKSEEK